MFGSRTRKAEPEKKKRTRDLSQFGLFDVPADLDGAADADNDNDSDLEAELAAITAGSAPRRAPPKKPIMPAADLDRMVAESLRDAASDDDEEIDENDPDLLSELHELAGGPGNDDDHAALLPPAEKPSSAAAAAAPSNMVDLLTGRQELYRLAEANAKAAGDAGKARRIGRGLKTLGDLLRQAKAGRPINADDIPPEVTTKAQGAAATPAAADQQPAAPAAAAGVPTRAAPAVPAAVPATAATPSPPEPSPTPAAEPSATLVALVARKSAFKLAALEAKRTGDKAAAIQCVRVLRRLDSLIAEAQAGRPIDLDSLPAAPQVARPGKEEASVQRDAAVAEPVAEPAAAEPAAPAAEIPPEAPTSIAEALQQRLAKYQSVEAAAKAEGNASKARRYGRIIKQYQDAIKAHRLGRPVAFEELPTPPGFAGIPGVAAAAPVNVAELVADRQPQPADEEPATEPQPAKPPAATAPPAAAAAAAAKPKPAPQPLPSSRVGGNHSSTALMQQTIAQLASRQAEFRRAAIEAKQAGNLAQAKEYLRQFKQLEQLLEVARGGLPVDLATVPLAPSQRARLEDSFTLVSEADCAVDETGLADISGRLEQQLQQQLAMCRQTRDHHRAMGDVAGTNRFENLAVQVQRDCDVVIYARAQNLPVPKFHYENKRFDIVRCNTDLADTELEISVCRGIGYSVSNPKDVDTYVKLEVPLPSGPEAPFKARTALIRDTDSPQYDERFVVEIAPKQRQCQRVFKRHAVKLEVFSKGSDWWLGRLCDRLTWFCCYSGFLRSDTLIGTVTVKLQPLETVCELHDSFDLMDGRKSNGGKLEVKLRTRNPILTTQIQHTEQKWLHIDS